MRALICGYYGEANLGDEALLRVLLDQLPPDCEALVTARDQEAVRRVEGVATVDRRRLRAVLTALGQCDALVLGGGSLLQDATSFKSLLYYAALILAARLRGKPVLLWGQGLGPLRRRRSRALVRRLLPMATAISWRDHESAALAAGWGVQAPVGSDPVWGLTGRTWRGHGGPVVLCWRPVTQIRGAGWRPYLAALDRLARESDRPVLWVPLHRGQDTGLLARLLAEDLVPPGLRERSCERLVSDPDQALDLFAGAGLVLAMRLHGLILAALAGSPCAALSYDPKVAAAAAGIGCPCHDLTLPPGADLLTHWQECLDHPPEAERIRREQERAGVHARILGGLQRGKN